MLADIWPQYVNSVLCYAADVMSSTNQQILAFPQSVSPPLALVAYMVAHIWADSSFRAHLRRVVN